jgi:hypothetical protein
MGISKNKPLVILRFVSQEPLPIKCIFRNPGLSIRVAAGFSLRHVTQPKGCAYPDDEADCPFSALIFPAIPLPEFIFFDLLFMIKKYSGSKKHYLNLLITS